MNGVATLHDTVVPQPGPVPDAAVASVVEPVLRMAARLLDAGLAAVLLTEGGQWIHSTSGPSADAAAADAVSPFCAELLRHPDALLVVEDAAADERFQAGPSVAGPPGIRFYAGVALRNGAGGTLGLLCVSDAAPRPLAPPGRQILLDLAAQIVAMLELRSALEDRRHATDLGPHHPWIADPAGRLLEVSPRIAVLVGMQDADLLDGGWTRFLHPDEAVRIREGWAHALRTGAAYDGDQRLRVADGSYRWFHIYAVPWRDAAGRIVRWYGSLQDIDARTRSQASIEHLAYHDALTGLANRVQFRRLLEQQVARVERGNGFALLRLDLDNFKAINDTLGHVAGDVLLTQVATRLGDCVRQTDILARDGDDEFFIVQTDLLRPEDTPLLAERIQRVLSMPMKLDGAVLGIGGSIGITLCPQDGASPDKLLQNSDLALGRAKHQARGSYRFFEPEMDERLRVRQALKIELRDALERGEFELAYQPLVGCPDGRIDGFEALLRWRHPTRGFVSPTEFIPISEQSGLILPIGRWVLEQACRDAVGWPDGIRVAVNLSVMQFRQHVLPQAVAAALEATGLPPERLELEITESVPLLDDEINCSLLRQLRELGTRIVLDDFGTGYASLGYLACFAFDKLKIDRSFIARLADAPDTRTIVNAVLRMSQALNIVTTAEGVETREQLDILVRAGCKEFQGFFFSRPVPASMIPDLLLRHEERRAQEDWCAPMAEA